MDGGVLTTPEIPRRRVVVTGAGRDLGRAAAIEFARRGAEVFLSARSLSAAEKTSGEIRELCDAPVHGFACDLTDAQSVRDFAAAVRERTDTVDVLINNAAGWLEGRDLDSASDEEIVTTIMSGGAGTVLASKYFLPLLTASGHGDIVNVISMAASRRSDSCAGHPAFYAAKGAQANFADVLSQRLRDSGVRVISLFPPDFHNGDPLQSSWHDVDRSDGAPLTAQSVLDCIMFAVDQPRDCYIRSIEFEPSMPRQG